MASRDTQHYDLSVLAQHARVDSGMRVLEMGYYDPGAALWAAKQGAQVVGIRPNVDLATELETRGREAHLGGLEVRIAVRPENGERGSFDVALLLAPFFLGNQPVRRALEAAAEALKPGGRLYFQVHRHHGGDTFVRFARECFGSVEQLGVGSGQRRLFLATEPRPVAAAGGEDAADAPLHELNAGGTVVRYRLAAGVFGAHGLDPASRLLVQTVLAAALPERPAVLDLGCGAGTIGLALAAADPLARVVLTDASKPAVDLALENAERNALRNAEVRLGDGYSAVGRERFDVIVSNLPAHRGHVAESATAERFIAGAPAHLRNGGVAWFVANRALPYELPASRAFREVRVAAADGRYKVLRCSNPHAER